MTGADLIVQARALLGVPFRHQGRNRYGVDCIGLVVLAARACGLDVSADRTDYPRDPVGALQPALLGRLSEVTAVWWPGDVLLMRFGNEPQHVALWTGAGIIHAMARSGRVVEHGLDAKWRRRVVAVYRFPEIG